MKSCPGYKVISVGQVHTCPLADICFRCAKKNKELKHSESTDQLFAYDKVLMDCPNLLNSAQWRVVKCLK